MGNKRVPEVRFERFSEDWEERKLGGIAKVITKGTTPRDKISQGDINFIKVENINPDSGVISITSKVTKEEHEGYLKRSQLEHGDILFSIAGTLGRLAIVNNNVLPANTNQALAIIRLNNENVNFLATYLKGKFVENYIRKNPTVGAQPNLSLQQVGDLTINFPCNDEQTKIGDFFKQLDDTIALHQQELTTLKQTKQGFLQKMFPKEGESVPEVRFPGFSGDWEKMKLNEVAEIIGGGTPSTNVQEYWGGNIDWYSPVEIGKEIYTSGSQRKITALGLKKSSAKILPANKTILFTSRAGIGDMAILKRDGATNQGFQSLVVNNNYDIYFVYSIGYKIKEFALKNASGSTFLEISGKGLGEMFLLVPSLEEQTKIGNFFKQLDDTITLHQRELDALKETKKAFLQKMFI
ncbi:restriction modification system DNA specificity domain-containing protein [Bacillus sp. TS-2]|nr:restriction modification system DNA specificity domain-containing protein [Bacillus sp. TS-2]